MHGGDQLDRPEQGDGALDVVGEDMEAHLGRDLAQRFCLEVAPPHPVLDRAEHMLDGSLPDPHGVGHAVEPVLHGFHDMLVFPARDLSLVAGRAAGLQRT